MKRPLLLSLGWIVAGTVFYLTALLLDVYWNLVNWRFKLDVPALGLLLALAAALLAMYFLACATGEAPTQVVSLIVCLVLVGAAAYAVQAEPETTGLFGRDASSPFLYRAVRLLIMTLPSLFWINAQRRLRQQP